MSAYFDIDRIDKCHETRHKHVVLKASALLELELGHHWSIRNYFSITTKRCFMIHPVIGTSRHVDGEANIDQSHRMIIG